MANNNSQGFGLIPSATVGNTPAPQGQSKYKIDAAWGTTIYNGECVKDGSGYLVGGNGSAADIYGVLNGIFYNAATTLKPTWANFYLATITPANSEDTVAFVQDNPFSSFTVAMDALLDTTVAAAQAKFLQTYDMNASAGSDTTGKSSSTLDLGTTSADGKQFRVLRVAEDPENQDVTAAYCSLVVSINLSALGHN
jgi:hypothetical protein|tara:strand:- start:42 stop:629 length:588 start_codon:yes stop_codon:yes gene_type:complete